MTFLRFLTGRLTQRVLGQLSRPVVLLGVISLGTGIFIAIGAFAPRVSIPILGTPSWTSWFDVYLAFPLLAVLVGVGLGKIQKLESLVMVGICSLPMALQCFVSYYWDYGGAFYSAETWHGQFFGQLFVSVVLGCLIYLATRLPWSDGLFLPTNRRLMSIAAATSLALALMESLLRPLTSSGLPLNSSGDIGITNAWGGYDLIHGVNPFATGLPPWGGPVAPPYGPMSIVLALPFSFLSINAAAHASTFTFAILSAIMIWGIVRLYNPDLSIPLALLFLALPLTMTMLNATASVHFMVTFLILCYVYLFLKERYAFAGLALALATLTLYFPFLLLLPLMVFSKRGKLRTLVGFLPITAVGTYLLVVAFPNQGDAAGVSRFTQGASEFIAWEALFGPIGGKVLFVGLLLVLAVFMLQHRSGWLEPQTSVLIFSAMTLLFIPALIGYTYAAYYLWSTALALVALAALPRLRLKAQPVPLIAESRSS